MCFGYICILNYSSNIVIEYFGGTFRLFAALFTILYSSLFLFFNDNITLLLLCIFYFSYLLFLLLFSGILSTL